MIDVFIASFAGFLFGILSYILYGLINDSRVRKTTKDAIRQEIQVNYYQVRDGKVFAEKEAKNIEGITNDKPFVVMNYNFSTKVFDSCLKDLPNLGDISIKIHHFYSRLKELQLISGTLYKLLRSSEEIKKENIPETIKMVDKNSLGSDFYQAVEEYHFFEREAFDLGAAILDDL